VQNPHSVCKQTRLAVIWSGLLSEPLLTIYGSLAFILRKDLQASPEQLAILVMLKPVVSIFSLYWSYNTNERRDKLLSNVIWAGILSRIPFLFFPFLTNTWAIIACAALYMMMVRSGVPAWMEILKLNLPAKERGKVFSQGAMLGHVEGAILGLGIGALLDYESQLWRWVFPLSSIVGMIGILLQAKIPIKLDKVPMRYQIQGVSFWEKLIDPWRSAWKLMKRRPDFFRFQLGFMICGSALMLMQPVLPLLFVDVLDLSFTEMMVALSICRGLGYACTAPIWARKINKMNIYKYTSLVFLLVGLYGGFLLCSPLHVVFVYIGFFIYGITLAGNHLSWNLSGPIFAENEDSSLFTSVNVVTVGLRGCIAPALGWYLCTLIGPVAVMAISMLLCVFAGLKMYLWGKPSIVSQELSI
jgi:hypothetical protein